MRLAWLLLVSSLIPASVQAAPARQFITDAIKGDNSEMTLGRIAARRGLAPGVRDFGARLRSDHASARAEAAALARAMHAPVPTAIMPEAARERARLLRLSGRAFDREFARYMVNDHREDIGKFEEQARTGDHGTAELARGQLPTLREHLRIAESLVH